MLLSTLQGIIPFQREDGLDDLVGLLQFQLLPVAAS